MAICDNTHTFRQSADSSGLCPTQLVYIGLDIGIPNTMLARCLTPEMNSSIIRGLNAGVWYAPLQWPQFECQVTAHVRAGKREYRDAPSTITTKLSA